MANAGSPDSQSRDVKGNAFDVLVRRNGWFLATFYALWALLAGLLSYARVATAENPPLAWPEIVIIVIIAVAATVGAAFPLAFGFVEGIPMVLAELRKRFYREEGREEGRAEGRAEGRQEANQDWEAWLERREAAERDGRPFTEPPPSRNGAAKKDDS